MKNRRFGMFFAVTTALCCTSVAYPDTKSGKANLQEEKGQGVPEEALKVSLGDKVKANCTYYIIPDFLGKKVVSVQANIKNTSDKQMYYGYYVAFLDKDKNLVGCSSFAGELAQLEPGGVGNIGSVIRLPNEQIKRIAFYQVSLWEDEKEFGK